MPSIFSSKRLTRSILCLAAPIFAAFAAPVHASGDITAWQPNDDDAILLDVRAGQWRVGDGVRGYQTDTGVCVDFGDLIMALDLPVRLDKKSRRATGWLLKESRVVTIDRELDMVQIVNNSQRLNKNDIRDTPEGWCVDSATLAQWLGIDVQPDLASAVLLLKSTEKLPFELAAERKARSGRAKPTQTFDLSSFPQANDPYRLWRTPSIDVVASINGSKQNSRGATYDAQYEIYASGELAGASFDARISSNNRGVPQNIRLRAYRTDPKGELLGPLAATNFTVGDVSSVSTALGTQSSAGRGASITNRPVERPESFDRTTFRGELPEGWDAELYRNGQLIGFAQTRGDGRYEFIDIPLLFGQNRFEVVLYGPQGQIRRDVKLIPVGADSIPPRETYYWAGIQDTGRDLLSFGDVRLLENAGWRGGFGLERGLNARTSIGTAFTSSVFRGVRQYHLESSLRRSFGPALAEISLGSDLRGGYALRGQALAQVGETAVSAETVFLKNGFRSERFDRDLRYLLAFSVDHTVTIFGQSLPIHLDAQHRKQIAGDATLALRSRLSFNLNALNISSELRWERGTRPSGLDPPSRLDGLLRLSGRVGKVRLRGETTFGVTGPDRGFRDALLTAEYRNNEKSEYRLQLGYNAQSAQARLTAAYTRRFDKLSLSGQVQAGTDGSLAAGVNLAFSLGVDPRGGIRVASEKLASSGQAFATVFEDENGDGIRQPGEPLQAGAELTAGLRGTGLPTDKDGTTIIDGLEPFLPILIGIDTASLPDPFIQPAVPGIVVTPRPGVPFIVELPLVPAGEVAGYLQKASGALLGGVDIELITASGIVIKSTRSEYDGFFLFESVPYGKYQIRIAALAANILGTQQQLPGSVELNKGAPIAELGIVIAQPAVVIANANSRP